MISGKVLDLLLLGLSLPLKLVIGVAVFRNGSFRKNLKRKSFTMLMKTGDLKSVRYYRLEDGRFKSKKADWPNADMSIVWSDSKAFAETIFKLNPLDIIKGLLGAMTAGKLAIEVNIEAVTAFISVLNETLGVYRHFFRVKQ